MNTFLPKVVINFKDISELAEEGEILASGGWGSGKGGKSLQERDFQDQGVVGLCSWQDKGQEEGPSWPNPSNNLQVGG